MGVVEKEEEKTEGSTQRIRTGKIRHTHTQTHKESWGEGQDIYT